MNNIERHNKSQNIASSLLGATILGATGENFFRQPLTAITVVMINQNKSFHGTIKSLYSEGKISRFYNGVQGFAISWTMRTSHRVATFGINQFMHARKYSNPAISLAITVAEFVTTAFGELVLTIAQTSGKKTPVEFIQERYRTNGFSSLTTGFLGNNGRNLIFNGVLFSSKNELSKELEKNPLLISIAITFAAVIASHPIEVVRSLKVKKPEKSYIHVIKDIYRESSVIGFNKGLGSRIVSAGIGTFITMYVVALLEKKNCTKS